MTKNLTKLAEPERCSRCKTLMYYLEEIAGRRNNKYICRDCKLKEANN